MANTIPCPNPACTHDFSMAEVQATAQLLCPKCGFRIQGTAPTKPAPAPVPAVASVNVPLAMPVTSPPIASNNPPLAVPVATTPAPTEESLPDALFFNPDIAGSTGTLVRTGTTTKKKLTWSRLLINAFAVGFAVSVVVAAVGAIVMWFPDVKGMFTRNDGDSFTGLLRNSKNENEKVYKLNLSRNDWSPDTEIKRDFKAHSAWRHNTEDFWFAVVVSDFGMFKPRDADVLGDGIDKLEQYFGDKLELDKMAEPAKFASLNAQKLQFVGTVRDALWRGECYMFFNNGIGYWLFAASPDREILNRLAAELAEKHFSVVSDRRGWREQPTPTTTYKSDNGKLEITVPKKGWNKSESPKAEYETGELELGGVYKKEKDGRKNATLIIFTLENKGDLSESLKAARDKLEAQWKSKDQKYNIVNAADAAQDAAGQKEIGAKIDFGNRTGRMIDLKLQFHDKAMRYFLLAVMKEGDVTYAIVCDSAWESRQIWRQDFLDVLRLLSVK
jgi:hypothetical protein